MIATVAGAWRYPVKSLQGEVVDELDLGPAGAAGDRVWGVLDRASGKVLTAKRWPTLLTAAARTGDGGAVTITLPSGDELAAGDPAADDALSAWLDRRVTLVGPADAALPYELTMDPTDDGSAVWDFATPPGSLVDLAAVHLLTDASLASARARGPASDWDVRRFRPSLLLAVDGPGDDFPEDAWVDRTVRCGDAELAPFMRTPRCAVPTRAQPGLARDLGVSRTLTDQHGNELGVYAEVRRPGRVRVGDRVTLA